jgi:hypothetical protein
MMSEQKNKKKPKLSNEGGKGEDREFKVQFGVKIKKKKDDE